jgi:hypothetical protein
MEYKDKLKEEWTKSGGLINKSVAAKILKVNKSVMTKRKDLKKIKIGEDIFLSYAEIMSREDIKPRKSKKKTENE